ncbi:MAG TPA: 30S ribosomal protein S12 methylthiotransferase RimO [Vicinamibacterales bacterium]|jgi:ribosomal protein S12 methylthiotransferase
MKIGFVSLGCPKNLVDSEVMIGLAQQAGHTFTPEAADADVLVVNTCSFIESARRESIDAILEMAQHKKTGRCQRLVVTGCMAERYRDELEKTIPEVDAILGTGEIPGIVQAVHPLTLHRKSAPPVEPAQPEIGGRRRASRLRASPTYIYDDLTPRTLTTPSHFAYVKIAEGCNYKCAFCIIPKLRGEYRSRPAASILREARDLAARGVKELLLVSQDTTYFGIDRGLRGALGRLLRQLNRVDGLAWIRLLYLYPTTITPDTLAAIAECERVCKYVDLPLQHASDGVLARMRRPGTRASYERLIARIRHTVPAVTLRTTFIVGFPGETAAEFEDLCRFVETTGFDHVGVFTYSHEEGTTAGRGEDDVPRRVKEQRRRELMRRQRRLVVARNRRRIGERVRVLVDGPSPEHPLVLRGRLEGQAPEIDPLVYVSDIDVSDYQPGDLFEAEVVAARGYDLVVRPLPVDETA